MIGRQSEQRRDHTTARKMRGGNDRLGSECRSLGFPLRALSSIGFETATSNSTAFTRTPSPRQLTPEHVAECLVRDAAELVKLLLELITVIPGLVPAVPWEPDEEKGRIFVALAQFFGRFATKQPLPVTVEDMHGCDDTSLEF